MADGCIFCAIVAGDAPSRQVYEDLRTLAFLDIFPVTPGHTLVIPKRHCDNVVDCPPDDLAAVFATAQRVTAAALDPSGLAAEGANLFQTNGAVAFQTVFHFHVHVLPRWRSDTFKVELQRTPGVAEEMDHQASLYRARLRT